jgi:hypothetical protein
MSKKILMQVGDIAWLAQFLEVLRARVVHEEAAAAVH